jgi:hypothetical protein
MQRDLQPAVPLLHRIEEPGERRQNFRPSNFYLRSRLEIGRRLGIKIRHRRRIKLLVPFAETAIDFVQSLMGPHAFAQSRELSAAGPDVAKEAQKTNEPIPINTF